MRSLWRLDGGAEGRETYECYSRKRDVHSCAQSPISRAEVDEAMLHELTEKAYVSLDETRERIAAKIAHDLVTARELREVAERDEQKARDALVRIGRDFRNGQITGAQWSRLEVELTGELEVANAKRERMIANERALAEAAPLADAAGELLRRLAELRAKVIEGAGDASNIQGLRRLLHDLFESVIFRGAKAVAEAIQYDDYRESLVSVPNGYLEPRLQPALVEGYDEQVRPILKRLPLPLGETEVVGLLKHYLFRPIPCGIGA